MGRGQWILAEGAAALAEWRDQEAEAREIFTRSYGPQAPEAAREMGQGLVPRLVFGWAALREKLLARELDLDDVALEALKIAIVREVPDAPVSGRTELRLVGSSEDALELAWLEAETEAELATLSLPREAYDAFANDTAAWQAVHAQFAAAMFVDFRRLFVG